MARSTIQDNLKRTSTSGLAWPFADAILDRLVHKAYRIPPIAKSGSQVPACLARDCTKNPATRSGDPRNGQAIIEPDHKFAPQMHSAIDSNNGSHDVRIFALRRHEIDQQN